MITAARQDERLSLLLQGQQDGLGHPFAATQCLPVGILPDDEESLIADLEQARQEAVTHPEELMTVEALVESIRAELRL
ncbi:MAG: hypothetical protein LBI33_01475 [Propionibacteriaceae bacterium]|jgi:hypothetical protein|nr:hypothetical protein [Propionibacteriaceae bacterium]